MNSTNKKQISKKQKSAPLEEKNEEDIYKEQNQEDMSDIYADAANNIASETSEKSVKSPALSQSAVTQQGAQTITTNENTISNEESGVVEGTNTDSLTKNQGQIAAQESPDEAGEQSVSGDMPTPDSDDDTLANAQAVGTQTHEDPEHPEEVDIGRDVDEAEEYERTH